MQIINKKNIAVALACSFSSTIVFAQTLNDVVSGQLATLSSTPCSNLLDGDSVLELTSELQTICTPPVAPPPSGSGPSAPGSVSGPASSASGGGAATPTSLAKIIKRRLKNNKDADSGGGASGDQTFELTSDISLFYQENTKALTVISLPFKTVMILIFGE